MRDLMTSMRCPKGLQNRTGTRYLFEQSNRTAFCLLKLHHIEIKFAESSWMSNKTILEFRVFSLHVEFLRIPGKNHYCTKDYMRIYVCLPISVYTQNNYYFLLSACIINACLSYFQLHDGVACAEHQ